MNILAFQCLRLFTTLCRSERVTACKAGAAGVIAPATGPSARRSHVLLACLLIAVATSRATGFAAEEPLSQATCERLASVQNKADLSKILGAEQVASLFRDAGTAVNHRISGLACQALDKPNLDKVSSCAPQDLWDDKSACYRAVKSMGSSIYCKCFKAYYRDVVTRARPSVVATASLGEDSGWFVLSKQRPDADKIDVQFELPDDNARLTRLRVDVFGGEAIIEAFEVTMDGTAVSLASEEINVAAGSTLGPFVLQGGVVDSIRVTAAAQNASAGAEIVVRGVK